MAHDCVQWRILVGEMSYLQDLLRVLFCLNRASELSQGRSYWNVSFLFPRFRNRLEASKYARDSLHGHGKGLVMGGSQSEEHQNMFKEFGISLFCHLFCIIVKCGLFERKELWKIFEPKRMRQVAI
jgi:hypothetical protein